ncbi:LiaF transmembrane domain-containing protein [Chitinophaga rhizophila]|uniref:Cell wall-active antibiotics response protein n=1 Tax=Chitinophaga rhizophila TaxID=2866212 RepID=A0ABS7GF70_9BACT|nr:DUF5668 domain-containing protein [Chitinophaga rhizophila]MBW8685153.1 cell wall-active antibiotics response protein [Chitinophaga rhizophila]
MDNQQYTNEDNWKERQLRKDEARRQKRNSRCGNRENHWYNKGLIFLLIGLFLFLRTMDLDLPVWAVSWQMLLIVIGLIIWTVSLFRNWGGLIVTLVGAVFFAKQYMVVDYNVTRFLWPTVFVIIGLALIFRRRQEVSSKNNDIAGKTSDDSSNYSSSESGSLTKEKYVVPPTELSSEDVINSTVIFSGEERVVVSKNFRGGNVTAIFGGAEYNLIQADFKDRIELEVTCIFGGVEITLPTNWDVRVEMDTIILGGVSDKRPVELLANAGNSDKILVIKGTCILGGIEIKSYN